METRETTLEYRLWEWERAYGFAEDNEYIDLIEAFIAWCGADCFEFDEEKLNEAIKN